tara:strand:+ start:274 stop:480 length:207 start_codon:yes stop_codon:yes gene_type:complete
MTLYHRYSDGSTVLHEDQSMLPRLLNSPSYTARSTQSMTFLRHNGIGDFRQYNELHYIIVHDDARTTV